MEHSETIGTIQKTSIYSLFKTHEANREVRESAVKRLIKIMKKDGWLFCSYIIVDKFYTIINGQHRFLAAQFLGIPIQYIRHDVVATAELIRKSNLYHMSWALEDTVNGFAAEGNEDYINLKSFRESHPEFQFTDVTMIAKAATRSAYRQEVESGNFKIKNLEVSEKWVNEIEKFKPYVADCYQRSFVRAVVKIIDGGIVSCDELIKQARKHPSLLVNYKNFDRNMEMFQRLHNKGKQSKNRVILTKI